MLAELNDDTNLCDIFTSTHLVNIMKVQARTLNRYATLCNLCLTKCLLFNRFDLHAKGIVLAVLRAANSFLQESHIIVNRLFYVIPVGLLQVTHNVNIELRHIYFLDATATGEVVMLSDLLGNCYLSEITVLDPNVTKNEQVLHKMLAHFQCDGIIMSERHLITLH